MGFSIKMKKLHKTEIIKITMNEKIIWGYEVLALIPNDINLEDAQGLLIIRMSKWNIFVSRSGKKKKMEAKRMVIDPLIH